MKRILLLSSVAFGIALAGSAHADERMECAQAYEQTQRHQQKNEFVTALDEANRCARPTCPNLLKKDCAKWVTEIQGKLPAVVVRVKGSDGCPHSDAKIDISGSSKKDEASDGIFVDPGTHDIVVSDPASLKTKTSTINFAAGEHRDIDIDFAGEGVACGAKEEKSSGGGLHLQTPTIVIGGIGAGMLVAGLGFGLIGMSKRDDLDACRPNCEQDKIDGVKPFFVIGDVVGAIGIVGIGVAVATYFWLQPKKEQAPPAKEKEKDTAFFFGPTGVAGTF